MLSPYLRRPGGRTLPLALALRRLADEARRSAGLGHQLQAELGALVVGGAAARTLVVLQSLDLLCQSLGELALCLDNCAVNAPADATLDPELLVEGLSLADVAARIAERPASTPSPVSGDLDLF